MTVGAGLPSKEGEGEGRESEAVLGPTARARDAGNGKLEDRL